MPDAEQSHDRRRSAHNAVRRQARVEVGPAGPVPQHTLDVLPPRHEVVHGVLHHGADHAVGQVGRTHRTVAEVRGQRQPVRHDGDGLGGRQRRRRHLEADPPVLGGPRAQLAEDGDDTADLVVGRREFGSSSARPMAATRWPTMATSSSAEAGSGSSTVLKRRRSALLESSLTPRSRSLAVAMALKPLAACTSSPSSGMGRVFSERMVMSVLDVRRDAGQLHPHECAGPHRPQDGARHECLLARPLGEQPGVVPAVAQRLLRRARRPLDEQRRVAGDRRREGRRSSRSSPCPAARGAGAPDPSPAWPPPPPRPGGDRCTWA